MRQHLPFFVFPILLAALLLLTGCACERPQYAPLGPAVPAARAPAPCAQCSHAEVARTASTPVLLAPDGRAYAAAQPVGVEYRVGFVENARAAFAVPPKVTACFVTGGYKILMDALEAVNCAVENLLPQPQPTARFVYAPPPASEAGSPPCAPR